jgi:hypothetical protein
MEIKTEEDINNLIKNKIEENTNLEYKDPRSLKDNKEIAKDISAMANSNGGLIIYGLCEDNKDHKPLRIEWIENHQEKERIEQILQANVTPKIDVQMNTIPNADSSKFVLVIDIPKSDKAPHQDHSDKDRKIYWRRNGYTTREMEHYEIEDLFFKRKRPLLGILLTKDNFIHNTKYDLTLQNKGKVLAEKVFIKLLIPFDFEISGEKWVKISDQIAPIIGKYCEYEYFNNEIPVYPGLPSLIGTLFYSKKKIVENLTVGFLMVCEDMGLIRGSITIDPFNKVEIKYLKDDERGVPLPSCSFLGDF